MTESLYEALRNLNISSNNLRKAPYHGSSQLKVKKIGASRLTVGGYVPRKDEKLEEPTFSSLPNSANANKLNKNSLKEMTQKSMSRLRKLQIEKRESRIKKAKRK